MGKKILIVEDETELAMILGSYLKVEGYETVIANDGLQGLRMFMEQKPDLLLSDIMLPKMDGIELCRKVREQSELPIIIVSAKSGEMDKVIALGSGADDYVTKPFSPLELVARVKALFRRYEKIMSAGTTANGPVIAVGTLLLDHSAYTALAGKDTIEFTTKEFDLLYYMAEHLNQVFSKEQLYQAVWGYNDCCDDNSVTVYINRIREKLSKYHIDCIKTVWGAGYKMIQGELGK